MNVVAEESFSNIRTVKALCSEANEIEKYREGNLVVLQAGKRKAFYKGLFSMA